MQCEDTCCVIRYDHEAYRAPSMWANFIHGWLFSIHLTELIGRTLALVRWQRLKLTSSSSPWSNDIIEGKAPAIVMILTNLFAFTSTFNVLGNILHYSCAINETLMTVSPWKCVANSSLHSLFSLLRKFALN